MANAVMDTRRLARRDFRRHFPYIFAMRDFTIAVTGHRPNRLPAPARETVRCQIGVLLDELVLLSKAHARRPLLVCALAEGADRMAAEAALERGIALRALLPFPAAEYAKDFPDMASQVQFREMMAMAERVIALAGDGGDRESAYEAAGLAMLDGADILIAVWDGQPAAGRGGTAQILEQADRSGMPVLVVDATAAKPPRPLSGGSIVQAAAEAISR
jgi:hypothetical protein